VAGWDKLTAGVVGVGVGEAAGAALEPVLDPLKQDAWAEKTPRVLDLGTLAQLAASGLISPDAAEAEGARSGYSSDRVQRAIQLSLEAAPVSELLELWRRGKISEALVDHGLAKAKIEAQYWPAIKELFYGRLDPAVVATAIQRGIMRDPGFLPVGPPTGSGKVQAFPVSPLDPIEEAKAQGIDAERLFVETAIVGLPLALVQAAQAYFRGVIELDDFYRAVSEGNTRNEWRDAALEVSRQIPTAHDGVEARLRGWIDDAGMYAQTARHGMSKADTDLVFKVLGRPLSFHQVFIGERRGGTYNGPTGQIDAAFLKSLQESNIRPEWYNLAWAQRYNYPTAFVLRSLTESGDINQHDAEQILLFEGWEPTLAHKVSVKWAGGTGTTTDANVKKAQTQLWTATHKSFVDAEIDAATARSALQAAGVDPASITPILTLWGHERALIRKQLSPKEIVKALNEGVTNPATGAPWTDQDAINALLERGYDLADAQVLIAE
jgi:hypothetical protein